MGDDKLVPCTWTRDPPPARRSRRAPRAFAALLALIALAIAASRAQRLSATENADSGWADLGKVPGAALRHRPQGMTAVGADLVCSNHRHDKGSRLFRYRRDSMELLAEAEMPPEATHTGGLAWDGTHLWATDYNANRIYELDLERTFERGVAVVLSSHPTGLRGTSAITAVTVDGLQYLAVSDFSPLRPTRTFLVRRDRVGELDSKPIHEVARVAYDNRGWSQGLAWDGAFLYEAVNGVARDHIWVIDIAAALRIGSERLVRHVAKLPAPGTGVEDLVADGDSIWISDERSFRVYRRDGMNDLRGRLGVRL